MAGLKNKERQLLGLSCEEQDWVSTHTAESFLFFLVYFIKCGASRVALRGKESLLSAGDSEDETQSQLGRSGREHGKPTPVSLP